MAQANGFVIRQLYLFQEMTQYMLKFKCRDVGFDCGWTTKGKTEDEILQNCAAHAQRDHNMKPEDINDELKSKIKSNIHKSFF
jgi:predicted small metal-binding protein